MSAVPPKADVAGRDRHVHFVPLRLRGLRTREHCHHGAADALQTDHRSYLINPVLMRAFIMIASQSSRDTPTRLRIPACLIVFPSLDSLYLMRSGSVR